MIVFCFIGNLYGKGAFFSHLRDPEVVAHAGHVSTKRQITPRCAGGVGLVRVVAAGREPRAEQMHRLADRPDADVVRLLVLSLYVVEGEGKPTVSQPPHGGRENAREAFVIGEDVVCRPHDSTDRRVVVNILSPAMNQVSNDERKHPIKLSTDSLLRQNYQLLNSTNVDQSVDSHKRSIDRRER